MENVDSETVPLRSASKEPAHLTRFYNINPFSPEIGSYHLSDCSYRPHEQRCGIKPNKSLETLKSPAASYKEIGRTFITSLPCPK